jgi:hypothetical protein
MVGSNLAVHAISTRLQDVANQMTGLTIWG